MKTLIENTALNLIQQNQETTTLEVKNQLIQDEPIYFWKQNFISQVMGDLANEGKLQYRDNGIFRFYSLPNAVVNVAPSILGAYKKVPLAQRGVQQVSLTELAKLVEQNAGKFITVVHTKRTDGTTNVMNCQILKDKTSLGAFQVKEQGQTKSFYPTDLTEVRVKGIVYQLK